MDTPYSFGDGWISAALVLFFVSAALGEIGGRGARHTRYLAERLASEGDQPSADLRQALANPRVFAMNYSSFLAGLAIIVLMFWRP